MPRSDERWVWHRPLMIASVLAQALVLIFALDVLVTADRVPRHTSVHGVDVGGLDEQDALRRLQERIGPRTAEPVTVIVGETQQILEPHDLGLQIDWPATAARADEQPVNPWTRLTTLVVDCEVDPVVRVDRERAVGVLREIAASMRVASQEASISFDGAMPVLVEPRPGRDIDANAAVTALEHGWLRSNAIRVELSESSTLVDVDAARRALDDLARPAVSGPLVVDGEGARAILDPEQIATALRFVADPSGELRMEVDRARLAELLRPALASTEQPAVDARIVIRDGRPVVEPSRIGRVIDFERTLADVAEVLVRGEDRRIVAAYTTSQPGVTTEAAEGLGIREIVGEFTTRGFASDSGRNIRRVAEEVAGAIVRPGETFSLNGHTGPRTAADGYVPAGIIEDGVPERAIGGGISQFATTLYNASYFAGMIDVEHKEHSYYISRYPVAREATVFEGMIDLRFRNPGKKAVLIETIWTPESITVRLWGTKQFEVTSQTSGRFGFTSAGTQTGPPGRCVASGPIGGFSATDTRTIRDLTTGETRTEPRTVTYSPKPRVVCPG